MPKSQYYPLRASSRVIVRSKVGLTSTFLGAATKTLAGGNLSTESSLLTDTGQIREAAAVCRGPQTLRYAFLLLVSISSLILPSRWWTDGRSHCTGWPISKIGWRSCRICSQQEHNGYLKQHYGRRRGARWLVWSSWSKLDQDGGARDRQMSANVSYRSKAR